MVVRLIKGFSITHKVIQIINLANEMVIVYDKKKGIDEITKSNDWLRLPVEVLVNTNDLLVVKQIDPNKVEKLKL